MDDPIDFSTFIKSQDESEAQKLIAYCFDDERIHLKTCCQPGKDVLLLVGPEGDFTQEEVSEAADNGFRGISLGESRLRTETAGIVACSLINSINTP